MQRYLKTAIITIVSFAITASLVHAVGNFYYDVANDGFVIQNVPVLEVNSLIAESRGTNTTESDLTITGKGGPVVFKLDADNNDTNAKLSILDGQAREIARFQENGILQLFGHDNGTTVTGPQIHLGDRWVIGEDGGPNEDFIVYDRSANEARLRLDADSGALRVNGNMIINSTFNPKKEFQGLNNVIINGDLFINNKITVWDDILSPSVGGAPGVRIALNNTTGNISLMGYQNANTGVMMADTNFKGIVIQNIEGPQDICAKGGWGESCLSTFEAKNFSCTTESTNCQFERGGSSTTLHTCTATCPVGTTLFGGSCWGGSGTVFNSLGDGFNICAGTDVDIAYAYCCSFN